MTVTISATNGSGSTSPLDVLSPYETARRSRNVIHDLIGGGIAVSLVSPRPRAGTIEFLYATEQDADACAALHALTTSFTLVETERPSIGMTYVVDGDVRVSLDPQSRELWMVSVAYQETP